MLININEEFFDVFPLPIKRKWYDMILSGEKKEEYRAYNLYYLKRFQKLGLIAEDAVSVTNKKRLILFRNGYSKTSPSFIARCSLSIGGGKPEWGAEENEKYYILHIIEIIQRS